MKPDRKERDFILLPMLILLGSLYFGGYHNSVGAANTGLTSAQLLEATDTPLPCPKSIECSTPTPTPTNTPGIEEPVFSIYLPLVFAKKVQTCPPQRPTQHLLRY